MIPKVEAGLDLLGGEPVAGAQESLIPVLAAEFTVADRGHPDALLHRHGFDDAFVLDTLQLVLCQPPLHPGFARGAQPRRPDEAAQVLGAERRLNFPRHIVAPMY